MIKNSSELKRHDAIFACALMLGACSSPSHRAHEPDAQPEVDAASDSSVHDAGPNDASHASSDGKVAALVDAGQSDAAHVSSEYGLCPDAGELFFDISLDGGVARHVTGGCTKLDSPYPLAADTGRGGGGDSTDPGWVAVACDDTTGLVFALGLSAAPSSPADSSISYPAQALWIDTTPARHLGSRSASVQFTAVAPQFVTRPPRTNDVYEGSYRATLSQGVTAVGRFRVCAITGHDRTAYDQRLIDSYGAAGALFP